jgi:hypothetical protein
MDLNKLADDLKASREEPTLNDLTDDQWHRVCNRVANAIHKQMKFDWDEFMTRAGCGTEETRKVT